METFDKAIFNMKDQECKDLEEICEWDLTKETLEEQSEETQRAINELLAANKNIANKYLPH